YYNKKQILTSEKIIFYRDLGLSLKEIQIILDQPLLQCIESLKSHKMVLEDKVINTQALINRLNKSVEKLEYEQAFDTNALYRGFALEDLSYYDQIAIDSLGKIGIDLIFRREKNTEDWTDSCWHEFSFQWHCLLKKIGEDISKTIHIKTKKNLYYMQQWYNFFDKL
ncbi:MAG: hypothetical protein CMF49_00345, partial [Legionellales bacterium]|nr:hypothetical protein [Legionellales bacterium]